MLRIIPTFRPPVTIPPPGSHLAVADGDIEVSPGPAWLTLSAPGHQAELCLNISTGRLSYMQAAHVRMEPFQRNEPLWYASRMAFMAKNDAARPCIRETAPGRRELASLGLANGCRLRTCLPN